MGRVSLEIFPTPLRSSLAPVAPATGERLLTQAARRLDGAGRAGGGAEDEAIIKYKYLANYNLVCIDIIEKVRMYVCIKVYV